MMLLQMKTTYEADPRHVQILVKELGLEEAKGVASPGVNRKDDESEPLSAQMCSQYRSLVMRANYLALDRPDIHYSAKELARKMSAPTTEDWASLKTVWSAFSSRGLDWFGVYKQQGETKMNSGCFQTQMMVGVREQENRHPVEL